jgi:hypothetical protein
MVLDLCFCLFFCCCCWWHSEILFFLFHELVFYFLFFNIVPLRMRGGENCGRRGKLKLKLKFLGRERRIFLTATWTNGGLVGFDPPLSVE